MPSAKVEPQPPPSSDISDLLTQLDKLRAALAEKAQEIAAYEKEKQQAAKRIQEADSKASSERAQARAVFGTTQRHQ